MGTTQNNTYDTGTTTSSDESRLTQAKRNLETREDFVGQSYRTIRDNPKTSAAIATGVAAAAAGGAFLLNRKNRLGTAFGHASSSDEINSEVAEMNEEAVEMASKGSRS